MELMLAKLTPFILFIWTSGHQNFHVIPFQAMESCEIARTALANNDWFTLCTATGADK